MASNRAASPERYASRISVLAALILYVSSIESHLVEPPNVKFWELGRQRKTTQHQMQAAHRWIQKVASVCFDECYRSRVMPTGSISKIRVSPFSTTVPLRRTGCPT